MVKKERKYQISDEPPSKVNEIPVAYHAFHKASMVRQGIPYVFLMDLMDALNLTKKEMAKLIDVSTKTLERHYKSLRAFKGLQSDRLLQLAELNNQGVKVFGSKEKFLKWLNSSHPALGNTTPKEWLDTQQGIEAISQELGRIEHGIFA